MQVTEAATAGTAADTAMVHPSVEWGVSPPFLSTALDTLESRVAVKIAFRTRKGKTHQVDVHPSDTISSVKRLVANAMKVDAGRLARLVGPGLPSVPAPKQHGQQHGGDPRPSSNSGEDDKDRDDDDRDRDDDDDDDEKGFLQSYGLGGGEVVTVKLRKVARSKVGCRPASRNAAGAADACKPGNLPASKAEEAVRHVDDSTPEVRIDDDVMSSLIDRALLMLRRGELLGAGALTYEGLLEVVLSRPTPGLGEYNHPLLVFLRLAAGLEAESDHRQLGVGSSRKTRAVWGRGLRRLDFLMSRSRWAGYIRERSETMAAANGQCDGSSRVRPSDEDTVREEPGGGRRRCFPADATAQGGGETGGGKGGIGSPVLLPTSEKQGRKQRQLRRRRDEKSPGIRHDGSGGLRCGGGGGGVAAYDENWPGCTYTTEAVDDAANRYLVEVIKACAADEEEAEGEEEAGSCGWIGRRHLWNVVSKRRLLGSVASSEYRPLFCAGVGGPDVVGNGVCTTRAADAVAGTTPPGKKRKAASPVPLEQTAQMGQLESLYGRLGGGGGIGGGNVGGLPAMRASGYDLPVLKGDGPFCKASRIFALLLKNPVHLSSVRYRVTRRFMEATTTEERCCHVKCRRYPDHSAQAIGDRFIVDPVADEFPPGFGGVCRARAMPLHRNWVQDRVRVDGTADGEIDRRKCMRFSFAGGGDDDDGTDGAKAARMFAHLVCEDECRENANLWSSFVDTLRDCERVKGKLRRGKMRADYSELYMCFGMRFAYSADRKLRHYVYAKGLAEEECQRYNDRVAAIMDAMWRIAFRKIDPNDLNAMLSAANITGYESRATFAGSSLHSQFACARNYMTRPHVDDDGLYGVIGALDPDDPGSRDIITHFLVTEAKLAIPIRSGDVLVFDPRVAHCAINPRNKRAYVFSCYASAKTIHAHVAQWMSEESDTLDSSPPPEQEEEEA